MFLTVDENFIDNLKERDRSFQRLNKEIIKWVIMDSIRPAETRGQKKKNEPKNEPLKDFTLFVSSIFFPDWTAQAKKSHEEWMNLPEKQKTQQLELASNILDNLTYSEMIQYLEVASSKSLLDANMDWKNRT